MKVHLQIMSNKERWGVNTNMFLYMFVIAVCSCSVNAQQSRKCGFAPEMKGADKPAASRMKMEDTLYIPVVFHIVYTDDIHNIPDEQIYTQLKVINEDFSRKNADTLNTLAVFKEVAANTRIQFYLATSDGVTGITRTSTTHGPFHNDDLHRSAQGGKDAWNTKQYLNVWVANLAPGIFGYGNSPGGPEFRDGVAIHYQYFGRDENDPSPYNLGRTLTHEIGHWLGLQHPWGTGGCESDDGLSDTPAQEGPSSGCDLTKVSCGVLNMVQNFMDTSDDACMNLFTKAQSHHMRNTLMVHRPEAFGLNAVITDVPSVIEKWSVFIYPNPVTSEPVAFMDLQKDNFKPFHVTITDVYGKGVHEFDVRKFEEKMAIGLHGLSNGIYIARISNSISAYATKIYLNLN
jgi:hypothetical protein